MALRNEATAPQLRRLGDERDIEVAKFELEKEDVMKLKPIYEAIHMFLTREEGFKHPHSDDANIEDLYWERWTPSGAKEQHIWWRAKKDLPDFPFLRWFVELDYQTLNVTKAEVAYKNKKVSGEKIDLIIRVRCTMQWDRGDKLKDSIFWRFRRMFFNRVYIREVEQKKLEFQQFAQRLQRLIRSYFEMAADQEYPVIFQPPMGYKEP